MPEKTQKCFGKIMERVKGRSHNKSNGFVMRRKCLVWRKKMREISSAVAVRWDMATMTVQTVATTFFYT